MPNIPEYTSQKGFQGLEPSDIGASAYEGAARRVHGIFSEAGEAVRGAINAYGDADEQQDTSAITLASVNGLADLNQSHTQAMKQGDQNDPYATAQKWHDDVFEPAMDKLEAGARTQKGRILATRIRAQQEEYFGRKTVADANEISGSVVKSNMDESANTMGQAVHDDPAFFDDAIKNFDTGLDAQISSHPGLSVEQAAQLRTELVTTYHKQIAKAAMMGAAETNPAAAQKWLASGHFDRYFTGPEATELNHYAIEQQKAQLGDVETARRMARQQADDASEAQANKILGGMVDHQTGTVQIPRNANAAILADQTLKPTTKLSLMGAVDRLSKPQEFHSDPAVLNGLLQRTLLQPGDPDALSQAEVLGHVGKDISTSDYNFISARLNAKTPQDKSESLLFNQTLTQAKSALAPSNMGIMADPQAQLHYSAFLGWFLPAYEQARKTKSAADLLDPHSPDYLLGKNASRLGQFGPTAESGFQSTLKAVMAQPAKPAAAPRKPIGDFMKGLLGGAP